MEEAEGRSWEELKGEMHGLVLQWLRGSACKEAAEAMEREVDGLGLLPKRVDYAGNVHRNTHREWRCTHPKVQEDHLEHLLRLLLAEDAKMDPNANVLPTLLTRNLGPARYHGERTQKLRKRYAVPGNEVGIEWFLEQREVGGQGAGAAKAQRRLRDLKRVDTKLVVENMQYLRTFRGHRSAVYCVLCDFKNRYVVTGADDRLVKIWSRNTGYLLRTCRGHQGDITDLAISMDSELLVSASNDSTLRVWKLDEGKLGECLSVHNEHTKPITSVRFCTHPRSLHTIFSASEDGACKAWDPYCSSASIATLHPAPPSASAALADPTIPVGAIRHSALPQHPAPPTGNAVQMLHCAFNKAGTLFAVGCSDFAARVWSFTPLTSKGKGTSDSPICFQICELRGHCNDVVFVEFSHDGDKIATASKDGSAKLWYPSQLKGNTRQARWQCIHTLKCPVDEEQLQRCRRARRAPQSPSVNNCCWSLDDSLFLAAAADKKIYVWDTSTGRLRFCMRGHEEQVYVIMSHPLDPRMAMTAGYDGQIYIWDVVSGVPVKLFRRSAWVSELWTEPLMVVDAQFTPDGGSVVASDNTGQFSLFASGGGDPFAGAQYDQFFARDYAPLVRDLEGNVVDAENQQPPEITARNEDLVNFLGEPYLEPYQSAFRLGLAHHLSKEVDQGPEKIFQAQQFSRTISQAPATPSAAAQSPGLVRDLPPETAPSDWQSPRTLQRIAATPPNGHQSQRNNMVTMRQIEGRRSARQQLLLSSGSDESSSENEESDEEEYQESSSEEELSYMFDEEEEEEHTRKRSGRKRKRPVKYKEPGTSDSDFEVSEEERIRPRRERRVSRAGQPSSSKGGPATRKSKAKANKREMNGKKKKPGKRNTADVNGAFLDMPSRPYDQYSWLLQTHRTEAIYVPQYGDTVFYIPQGHKVWLEALRDRKSKKPWEAAGRGIDGTYKMNPAELCKIKKMEYIFCSDGSYNTTAMLTLEIVGEESNLQGWTFELELPHPSNDQPDFLVDPARFNESLDQQWQEGSRCKVMWLQEDGTNTWYNATIMELCPEDPEWPLSPYLRYKLLYDADFTSGVSTRSGSTQELYQHSLWELFKMHSSGSQGEEPLRSIAPEVKDEIQAAMQDIFSDDQYELFFDLVPADASWLDPPTGRYLAYNMVIHLPIALSVVSERIDNSYYRSVEALKHDLVQIVKNSSTYNGYASRLTRSAKEMVEKICIRVPSLQAVELDMDT